jgi:hypothetical protein
MSAAASSPLASASAEAWTRPTLAETVTRERLRLIGSRRLSATRCASSSARAPSATSTRELVTAEPGDEVLRPQDGAEPGGDGLEHLVSEGMSEAVVDALEPVEVEQEQRRAGGHGPASHRRPPARLR